MKNLTSEQLTAYAAFLRQEERAPATVEKYLRDASAFALWLEGREATKEQATA